MSIERHKIIEPIAWGLTSAAIFAGGYWYGHEKASSEPTTVSNSITLPLEPRMSVEDVRRLASKTTQHNLVSEYIRTHESFSFGFNNFNSIDGKKAGLLSESAEGIRKAFDKHLEEGVALVNFLNKRAEAQFTLPLKPNVQKSEQAGNRSNYLYIDGIAFNLDDNFQFRIANALVYEKIHIWGRKNSFEPYDFLQDEQKDLLWIAKSGVNIKIEDNFQVHFSESDLILLSRSLQILERANIPYPRKIEYRQKTEGEQRAFYKNHNSQDPFSIVITEDHDSSTIFHEMGHYVADVRLSPGLENNLDLQAYSQEAFNALLKDYQKQARTRNARLFFFNEYLSEDEIPIEEYAEAFKAFFQDGKTARQQIREEANPATKLLRMYEYIFFKSVNKGVEYQFGLPVEFIGLNEDVFKYDQLIVNELDLNKSGVEVYSEPKVSSERRYHITDGESAIVLDGPEVEITQNGTEEFWKVKYVYIKDGKAIDSEGFIKRSNISKVVPANQFTIPRVVTPVGQEIPTATPVLP